MKSRTSSCKTAAFRKDFSRFWPVWVGYILCLAFLQVVQSNDDLSYWYAANMAESIPVMGLVNCVYALVVAQMLFGDLFNTRMCNGLHALPLKREQWYSAHIKAGILFSLIPTVLVTAFSEGMIYRFSTMVDGWQIPLLWLLNTNLQYLFFFGLAVFCAMCAGNRFAMTVVYGILNFASMLCFLLVDQLYTPLLKGVITQSGPFELLCPMWQIVGTRFVDCERMETGKTYLDEFGIEQREYVGIFTIQDRSWIYVAVLAVLGILLLLAARAIYKKRRLECAGDFLSARWLEPAFQVIFTVLCAAGFHAVFYIFFGSYSHAMIIMAIGLLTGWFAGRMFLERSTRVFRLKNIAGFVLLAAVLAGSLYTVKLDPTGIATWVPESQDMTQVSLGLNSRSDFTTEDPAEMGDLMRLHELAISNCVTVHPDYDGAYHSPITQEENAFRFTLTYRRPNGWISQREYTVRAEGEMAEIVRRYCSRLNVVIPHAEVETPDDVRTLLKSAERIVVSGHFVADAFMTEEFLLKLADAIIADCEAQTLIQSAVFHPDTIVEGPTFDTSIHSLYLDINGISFFTYFNIYADSENILALLETTNVMDDIREEQEFYYGKS